MVVPFPGMVDGNDGDTTYIEETDFSIVPKNIRIWPGKFPYAKGMNVLTPDIKESATKIKTYTELYKSNYNDIYSDLFSFKDMARDTFGYSQILNLNIANPDFEVCTEAWVDLLGSKAPRIDGNDAKKISKVSNLLSNSNFTESFRDLIRGGEIMFGNKVFLIEKLSGGNTKIIDMPLKCWIPFVNSRDTSTIEVNIFFNIYTDSDNKSYCEFISYYENGHVEKVVFEYNKESDTLGDQFGEVEETEAFDNKGVSPIVVGTFNQIDNEIRGRSLYEKWKSSIKSCLKAYETVMILTEKLKQGKWVLPDGTAETEDSNGTTFVIDRGVVLYKNNNMPPKVEYIVPQVSIDNAIKTYKETLSRISRDTDLSMAFFDARELGTQISAKSLRTNMFRTELKAKSMTTMLERPVKQLICKFALANGIDLDVSEFSVTLESGFVQDIDEQVKLIQARGGVDTKSMTQVDVIKAYDSSMSISQAQAKANEINGIKDDSEDLNIEVTDSGKDSEVTDGIGFSATSNIDKKDGTKTKPVYLVEV